MKKLCSTLILSLLLTSFVATQAQSASKSKKSSKKKKQTTVAAATPAPTAAPVETAPQVARNNGIPREKLAIAYNTAKELYAAKQFDKAKDIFKKIATVATDSDISANSLYLYSQCAFRTEDYSACVRGLNVLSKRWPNAPIIKTGYVSRFCYFLINEISHLQTNWDYYRFKERTDETGNPVWKESVPPGFKIKRINFKLAFGLFKVLKRIEPTSNLTLDCKTKLDKMLNSPITMVWVDEKAPPNKYGHPADFFSVFSTVEKKDFSNVICERMFFDWKSEKFYQFLDMYDDVRNLKPRFIAKTKIPEDADPNAVLTTPSGVSAPPPPPGAPVTLPQAQQDPSIVLTLNKLFLISGYNPYEDSYTNLIESSPTDLNL